MIPKIRPKTFQNVTKQRTEKTTKKSAKNTEGTKPVLAMEREARLIIRCDPQRGERSLANCLNVSRSARSLAALAR